MNTDRNDGAGCGSEPESMPAAPAHPGSGHGASTALEALIRRRKLVETPDDPTLPAPAAPPAPAPPTP